MISLNDAMITMLENTCPKEYDSKNHIFVFEFDLCCNILSIKAQKIDTVWQILSCELAVSNNTTPVKVLINRKETSN